MPRIFMVQTQKHAQLTLLLLDWSQAAGSPHPCATRSSHSVFTAVTGDELIARPPEAASRDQSEVHPDSVASGHWRSIARRVRDRAATGSAGPSSAAQPFPPAQILPDAGRNYARLDPDFNAWLETPRVCLRGVRKRSRRANPEHSIPVARPARFLSFRAAHANARGSCRGHDPKMSANAKSLLTRFANPCDVPFRS